VSQVLALFVKAIRKFARALEGLRKQEIGAELGTSVTATVGSVTRVGDDDDKDDGGRPRRKENAEAVTNASEVAREMEAELEEEGDEVVRQVRDQQRELIDSLDLDQYVFFSSFYFLSCFFGSDLMFLFRYAIAGNEDEWNEAGARMARARERDGALAASVVSVKSTAEQAEKGTGAAKRKASDAAAEDKRRKKASWGDKKVKKAKR
jgi:N-acetyltransferase 10